jgi:hypothetical protein
MKGTNVILIVLLAGLPGLALSEGAGNSSYVGGNPAKQPGNISYVGDNLAKQVCTAVVNDNVRKLRLALLTYKQSLAHRYTFDTAGRQVLRDFTCNGMDVQSFSQQVGATKVASFISGAVQAPDAQVAASGK